MKNKTLLVLGNVGLLLIMFSRLLSQPLSGAMMLNGIAVAGLAGVIYLRQARHAQKQTPKDDRHAN